MDHIQKHRAEQAARIYGSYNNQTQQVTEEELEKSANDYFEKGKKAAAGEVRKFGGVDYIKTANGWRKVGKNKGKTKDVHDAIHGSKEDKISQAKGFKSKEHEDLFNKMTTKKEKEGLKKINEAKSGKKNPFKSEDEEDEAYQKIREEIMEDYDDPEDEDEDRLNRDADDIFEERYGFKRGSKKYK